MSSVKQMEQQTILIVDDQPLNIEILNEVLQDSYRIVFATNGLDALELVESQKPDLLLLDVVMPGIDGYQVASRLKADPVTQQIPIIFITSMSDKKYETTGLQMGAVDYIIKPIDPDRVLDTVRRHLQDPPQPS
ncbi:MAG: response regulator [Magnetococcus sp. YQC-5]